MHLIRDAGAMAAIRALPLDPELRSLLTPYAAALEEFGEDLQADILIVEAGDTLAETERAYGERLVAGGCFLFVVELIARHGRWYDVVRIICDDGSGLVLLVEIAANTDAELLLACERALADMAP